MKKSSSKFHYEDNFWERSEVSEEEPYQSSTFPKVSIIIPTRNSAHLIAATLEALFLQDYPDFEVIIIDASSHDRTLDMIKSFHDPRVRVYSVSEYSRYEMLNKGITHAHGTYLNFLFPGDYYLYKRTLREMMKLALMKGQPAMVYCGALLREGKKEVKILYRKISVTLLRSGKQPTSLQSCWFHQETFQVIGKFNTALKLRGGLDLLCRLELNNKLKVHSCHRIFTDYDLRSVTRGMVIRHFKETFDIVRKYFGITAALVWLVKQNDAARYLKLWWRSLNMAFRGK